MLTKNGIEIKAFKGKGLSSFLCIENKDSPLLRTFSCKFYRKIIYIFHFTIFLFSNCYEL